MQTLPSVALASATCLALAAPLTAQNTFVVPSKALTSEPAVMWGDAAYQNYPFWGTMGPNPVMRVMYLYDVADIPVANANLNAVSVRPGESNALTPGTFQTTIVVSMGPNPSSSPNGTFSANHGPSPIQVFSGGVNLPRTSALRWPTPWQTPIAFAQPVPYSSGAGQSLVIEFQTTSSTSFEPWTIEGYREESGFVTEELYQQNCFNSAGDRSGQWGVDGEQLLPGGMFQLSLLDYPTNSPLMSANALMFALSGVGTQFGSLTTPFNLTDLGLIAPNNCKWAIDVTSFTVPMNYVDTGTVAYLRVSGIAIPNAPILAGASFYTQNLALDTFNGLPMLFPSVAMKWTIGTGNTVPVGRVLALPSTSLQQTGIVTPSNGATLQFHY